MVVEKAVVTKARVHFDHPKWARVFTSAMNLAFFDWQVMS